VILYIIEPTITLQNLKKYALGLEEPAIEALVEY